MQQGAPSSTFFMSPMPYRARSRGSSCVRSSASNSLLRGEDLEGALGEAVQAVHRPRERSSVAPQVVELRRAATGGWPAASGR